MPEGSEPPFLQGGPRNSTHGIFTINTAQLPSSLYSVRPNSRIPPQSLPPQLIYRPLHAVSTITHHPHNPRNIPRLADSASTSAHAAYTIPRSNTSLPRTPQTGVDSPPSAPRRRYRPHPAAGAAISRGGSACVSRTLRGKLCSGQ